MEASHTHTHTPPWKPLRCPAALPAPCLVLSFCAARPAMPAGSRTGSQPGCHVAAVAPSVPEKSAPEADEAGWLELLHCQQHNTHCLHPVRHSPALPYADSTRSLGRRPAVIDLAGCDRPRHVARQRQCSSVSPLRPWSSCSFSAPPPANAVAKWPLGSPSGSGSRRPGREGGTPTLRCWSHGSPAGVALFFVFFSPFRSSYAAVSFVRLLAVCFDRCLQTAPLRKVRPGFPLAFPGFCSFFPSPLGRDAAASTADGSAARVSAPDADAKTRQQGARGWGETSQKTHFSRPASPASPPALRHAKTCPTRTAAAAAGCEASIRRGGRRPATHFA